MSADPSSGGLAAAAAVAEGSGVAPPPPAAADDSLSRLPPQAQGSGLADPLPRAQNSSLTEEDEDEVVEQDPTGAHGDPRPHHSQAVALPTCWVVAVCALPIAACTHRAPRRCLLQGATHGIVRLRAGAASRRCSRALTRSRCAVAAAAAAACCSWSPRCCCCCYTAAALQDRGLPLHCLLHIPSCRPHPRARGAASTGAGH